MLWYKTCTRCSGDLQEEHDSFGPFVYCVQCGHHLTELEERILKARRNGGSQDKRPNMQPWHLAPVAEHA